MSVDSEQPMYAHTRNDQGEWHMLVDHLTKVANRACQNAKYFGLQTPAFWIGLWHDLGKANPEFQAYLHAADQNLPAKSAPHAFGGAAIIYAVLWGQEQSDSWKDIALPIAGHHAGLHDAGTLSSATQLTFAKSLDPIHRMDCGITRKAVTKEADRKRKENEMGRKPIVSYGLYRGFGFYSPYLAQKTPKMELTRDNIFVSENDLKLLWEACWKGFDNDHSACRHIKPRGVYVFTHSNARGNAPSHRLFEMLKIELEKKVKEEDRSPSQFCDYDISLPSGELKLGSSTITIISAEDIKDGATIPENAVIFTKIYHEPQECHEG